MPGESATAVEASHASGSRERCRGKRDRDEAQAPDDRRDDGGVRAARRQLRHRRSRRDGSPYRASASEGTSNGGAGGTGEAPLAARLALSTEAIDLGWVTTNFSARARIRVDNVGTAPLPAPTVGFAEGSHADFSLIQNGCELEVAPGESCELRVQLVPSDSGERAATLEVRSDVGGEARVALSGQGLAAGDLILAPVAGSFEDFGGARVGSTAEETFSISNPSDVASGPLRFRSNRPEFALLAPGEGDCVPDQTSLVGGQSCTLRLAFTPSERGPLEATLTGASDGVGAVSVTLVGRGLLPATLSASTLAVDFAGVVLTSSAKRSVLFQNAGDEPLTLVGARLAPETAEGFSILNSDCGAGTQIEGGASCSVQLEFRPPRLGEEFTAELLAEGAEAGQTQSVALRGIGLEQGALTVSATAAGDDDFGEVLLGESSERLFQIQNPSAQSSGVLDIVLSEGFALAPPVEGAAGECVPGSTSLVDGEACTVRVLFTPSLRGLVTGSLTVSSPLAGATELPLTGRGIVPALLAVERELNFGRMLTGSSGVRTLTIENEGDQPLPPPSFELTGSAPAQVAAFALESQCTAPLALGETCDLNLTFAPTDATAHAVTLNISSMGTNTSVLLLGEAQVPGSLVLSAADSGAFGDVPTGTTTSRSFVLANPGQIPSGRVTISSDNPRFATDLGDCNQGDPAGLVDGTSCTFNVRFTPDDNLPQAANLSVQSPGAGRAGLQLSGRGRQPAVLVGDGQPRSRPGQRRAGRDPGGAERVHLDGQQPGRSAHGRAHRPERQWRRVCHPQRLLQQLRRARARQLPDDHPLPPERRRHSLGARGGDRSEWYPARHAGDDRARRAARGARAVVRERRVLRRRMHAGRVLRPRVRSHVPGVLRPGAVHRSERPASVRQRRRVLRRRQLQAARGSRLQPERWRPPVRQRPVRAPPRRHRRWRPHLLPGRLRQLPSMQRPESLPGAHPRGGCGLRRGGAASVPNGPFLCRRRLLSGGLRGLLRTLSGRHWHVRGRSRWATRG